jgi:hypothetical protein
MPTQFATPPARGGKPTVRPPYLLALTFPGASALDAQAPVYHATRVEWTREGRAQLLLLRDGIARHGEARLPLRDLRLRLQVNDAQVRRLDRRLGSGGSVQYQPTLPLLFTTTPAAAATAAANAAVQVWVRDTVRPMGGASATACQELQRLAELGQALTAVAHPARVFAWEHHPQTFAAWPRENSTQFADLADYVAGLLAGRELFPGAGPLRQEASASLTANTARLFTDPIRLAAGAKRVECFSLGLTVSVETYPGRPLPVVQIRPEKRVWATKPRAHFKRALSGYVLPVGEDRALRFSVEKDLGLGTDYAAIARRYGLPQHGLTAAELARDGDSGTGSYEEAEVVITHRHGQGESFPAQAGLPDQDRADCFANVVQQLAVVGFSPWTAVAEVLTPSRGQADADGAWRFFDPNHTKSKSYAKKPLADQQLEDFLNRNKAEAWQHRMRAATAGYYGGTYRLVLGYQSGQHRAASYVRDFLTLVLGVDTVAITLLALPDGVHGPRAILAEKDAKAEQRAAARAEHWQPFMQAVRELMPASQRAGHAATVATAPDYLDGLLILAAAEYPTPAAPGKAAKVFPDDRVNKRAARITLNRELNLPVQYLLPPLTGKPAEELDWLEFQQRLVNAWRDVAWKFIGYVPELRTKLSQTLMATGPDPAPVLLGFGVVRANRTGLRQNATSFIPYAIELNPATGVTRAALLLTSNGRPQPAQLEALPQTIHRLTANGASYLQEKDNFDSAAQQRKQYTQLFVHDILDQAAREHPAVVAFFDQRTLVGAWDWLSDKRLDPSDVLFREKLGGPAMQTQLNWLNVALVRLRGELAPKALREAPQTRLLNETGETRFAARHCEAQLLHLTDTAHPQLHTYLSFGSDMDTSRKRGASCYRELQAESGAAIRLHRKRWGTPNGLEITVIQNDTAAEAVRYDPAQLAELVETLRFGHAHAPGWTALPAPLHFATVLRQYVPDYALPDNHDEANEAEEGDEAE